MESAKEVKMAMGKELYVAAMKGDVEFLEETQNDEFLLRKTHEKNNIIHIATRHEKLEFIEAFLRKFPNKIELICEKNSRELNTPLHIAAEVGNLSIVSQLYYYCLEERMIIEGHNSDDHKPWRFKNSMGNTAVHVALIHGNVKIARFFLDNDPQLVCVVNESKETPLHLAIKHHVDNSECESIMAGIEQLPQFKGGNSGVESDVNLLAGEEMSNMLTFLVEKGSSVTCWPDANGLTPLHRAASLSMPYNLQMIRFILYHCPESAEVCDTCGKSILHYLINRTPNYQEAKNLLGYKEIYALRNYQDHKGNTPLHLAAQNMDVSMVRALLKLSSKLSIKNIHGISVASLITQHNLLEMLQKRKMTKEDILAAEKGDIRSLKYRLSVLRMDFLRARDTHQRNILHKILDIESSVYVNQDGFDDFIRQLLSSYPVLVDQTDVNGDTPIHLLVQRNVEDSLEWLIVSLLDICNQFILETQDEVIANTNGPPYDPPWIVQNVQGNTPLHEALINTSKIKCVVTTLIDYDKRPIYFINKRRETPLHLIKDDVGNLEKMIQFCGVSKLHSAKDHSGFSPLMRAIQEGWEDTAIALFEFETTLCKERDGKGNTLLHLAVQNKRFRVICHMFDIYERSNSSELLSHCFEAENNALQSPANLIGEMENVPSYIEERILRHHKLRGIRSAWGIPKSHLQNYMSSVNVIAALLTTITFTAAFTVPGGLNQENGTPLLMKSIAFQVFMISDVIAMCLSMMVLFCLLWIVATNKRNSVMIQDFAVSLLLASFVVTLLTFMAGVYSTVFSLKPWIAIATLVLCSMLVLLVHKLILTKWIIPSKNATVNFFHMSRKRIAMKFVERKNVAS